MHDYLPAIAENLRVAEIREHVVVDERPRGAGRSAAAQVETESKRWTQFMTLYVEALKP